MTDNDTHIDLETLASIAESLDPRGLSPARREAMHARALARINAPAPAGTRTVRAQEGHWQSVMPLVDMKVLRVDHETKNQTVLYRLHPGAEFPVHTHTQEEECYVLEGEIHLGDYYVRAGDMHIAAPGSKHRKVKSSTGALLLIRSEMGEVAAV